VALPFSRLLRGLAPHIWYPVVDRHTETTPPEAPEGYVWVDTGERLQSCWAAHLAGTFIAHPYSTLIAPSLTSTLPPPIRVASTTPLRFSA
jgi:hypothetical protein